MKKAAFEQHPRLTWTEMVERFPDRWVVIRDPVMDGADLVSGVLVTVKTDDEILDYRMNHLDQGYEFWRTTEGDFYGIIDANYQISVD